MYLSELIPLAKALEIVDKKQKFSSTETVNLIDAHLRVNANEIVSLHNAPPFDRSAMDGFAVIAEDTFTASQSNGVNLKIVDDICAGSFSDIKLKKGEAIRIATGAPIPKGADAVIMEEFTNFNDKDLTIYSSVAPKENIAPCGEDIKKDEIVLAKNSLLRAQELALISSAGYGKIEVYKKPKVKVIITGSELVEPSKYLDYSKIINSNKYTIKAMVESTLSHVDIVHCDDDMDLLKEELIDSSKKYDVIISTGGTAISKADLVVDAIHDLGEVLFHGVAMRPGKAIAFGEINNTPIFMLSGYPVAAMVQFDVFVRHYLYKYQNITYNPRIEKIESNEKIFSNLGRTDYLRVYSSYDSVEKVFNRGSGIVRSMVLSNAYLIIDENLEGIAKGDIAKVLFFENMNPF